MALQQPYKELITRHGLLSLSKHLPGLESFKSSPIYRGDSFLADQVNGAVKHLRIPGSTSQVIGAYAILKQIDCDPELTVCWVTDFTTAQGGKSKFFSANIRGITEFRALSKAYKGLMNAYELDMEV